MRRRLIGLVDLRVFWLINNRADQNWNFFLYFFLPILFCLRQTFKNVDAVGWTAAHQQQQHFWARWRKDVTNLGKKEVTRTRETKMEEARMFWTKLNTFLT
jgi:hypothetical protein